MSRHRRWPIERRGPLEAAWALLTLGGIWTVAIACGLLVWWLIS